MTSLNINHTWNKIITPIQHADFITHLNYLICLSNLSKNLSLKCRQNVTGTINESQFVKKKIKLIELTVENINEEFKKIKQFPDYSQICISWIPVKSYYLFFNLLMLIEYLFKSDDKWLRETHKNINEEFIGYLKNRDFEFNVNELNQLFSISQILVWKIPPGNNIMRNNPNHSNLIKQLIKKILEYKKEDYKRRKNISSLRGKNKKDFDINTTLNLCEFFYWYRIKANYRDMEFIDSGVPIDEFVKFYSCYYQITMDFYNALRIQVNNLSVIKLNKQLL